MAYSLREGVDGNALVDRWLIRYGLSNAYERWLTAEDEKKAALAFIAIASEPRILMRINRADAAAIVQQSQATIDGIKRAKSTEPSLAAADVVANRIIVWRAYASKNGGPGMDRVAVAKLDPEAASVTVNAWKIAVENFPEFIEAVARPLVDMTLQLGASRLALLGESEQKVLALQTVRFAARSRRGNLKGPAQPKDLSLNCLSVVQEWSTISGKNALMVPYGGRRHTIQECAQHLLSDAMTSVEIAQDLPDGLTAPGFQVWEAAEEFHAYAVVSMVPQSLRNMTFERARGCAAAAGRLAQAHLHDPAVELPNIPEFCEQLGPKMVLATVRAVTGADIPPRRSAAGA